MRATLNNYEKLSNLKNFEGDDLLEAFKSKKELEASISNTTIPVEMQGIVDIGVISFGHFQILEKIITSGLEYLKLLKLIAPFLLRPAGEDILDNENKGIESRHRKMISDLDIGIVFAEFDKYLKLRDSYLFKTYNGVIYKARSVDDKQDDDDDDDVGDAEVSQSARGMYDKKFFWHNLTMFIAGDFWHEQDALDAKMGRVIVHLAEDRNKNIVETLEHRASLNR